MMTAHGIFMHGIRFFATFCARKSEKKTSTFEWEARLSYVGEDHEAEDGEAIRDEHDTQFERSCGVTRYRD